MKKKAISILLSLSLLAAGLTGCGGSGDPVSVQSVAMITGVSSAGLYDRYGGVVESGETVKVQKDDSMELKDINVEVGDTVTKGQTLFSYNTETLSLELEKKQLELEQLQNTITTKKSQIQSLEKEKQSVAASEQLEYTIQINQLQIDVKEAEYNVTAKQKEIDRSKATLANATVVAPVDGRIQAINKDNNQQGSDYNQGDSSTQAFITISQSGSLRIKGIINEQNAQSLSEGLSVIIRSRTDDTLTWNGTVTKIDWENPATNTNNNYYYDSGSSDEMSSSSKYPFYIELQGEDGLMLGQHVYIEPDLGQTTQAGLQLPEFYINDADTDAPWVWAANDKDKLEKRTVTLGAYDEALGSYEILDGLTLDDYIAAPEDGLKEGRKVVRYDENSIENGEGGEGIDDGAIGDGSVDDGMVDTGMLDGETDVVPQEDATADNSLPSDVTSSSSSVWPDDSIEPVTGMAPATQEGAVG